MSRTVIRLVLVGVAGRALLEALRCAHVCQAGAMVAWLGIALFAGLAAIGGGRG